MAKTNATKTPRQKVTFSYAAPKAQSVLLAGDFTGWQQAPLKLKKGKDGVWKTAVSLPPGIYEYRMLVDGQWENDPQCPTRRPNQFGGENCVCKVERLREPQAELV
jgi:1,4-alpha-glucan branching enzyme